ncbi:MAG: flagellar FliJ family protein [Oscillospiraceae bacterium]|nr:flagellar FliJ family protein [Oscillospiraceae bacterium]
MKKFKFSLDTVLKYKDQVLDALKGEHAAILVAVREQEDILEAAWRRYREYNEEFCAQKLRGLSAMDAMMYQSALRAQELEIQRQTERLDALRAKEESKRNEVVEAKKDTASLEKLRERKLDLYHKGIQKGEEQMIEEFISTQRAMTSA